MKKRNKMKNEDGKDDRKREEEGTQREKNGRKEWKKKVL